MENEVNLQLNERLDVLYPSELKIIQSKEVFSYSMDAVLLAHFARVPLSYKSHIIDLCAGNGAVTMAIARQTKAPVLGIEIQERLVDMARRSSTINQLEEQVSYRQQNLLDAAEEIKSGTVDMITCNPPYFKTDPNRQNPNKAVALAKHEITLDMPRLLQAISRLLKRNGTAYLVYSTDRFIELLGACKEYRLTPKRLQMVYPKPNRASKFFLIECIKDGSEQGFQMIKPLFIMNEQDEYSKEMSQILYGK